MARPDTMTPHPALQPYARSAVVRGTRLFYYDAGPSGQPPVVLVHGLGDEADTWRHILPALAMRRRVIAPDLPGFGRSDGPARGYSSAFFAQAVGALLAELRIDRATLVGHSMGAAIVQRLALARPDLAERLVLIDGGLATAPSRPPPQIWLFLAPGLGEAAYTSLRRSQDMAYATLRPYYHDLDALPPDDRAFLRERVWARVWSAKQRRAFLSALRWLAIDGATRADAFRERAARRGTPTLLIWGERDLIVPLAAGEALAAQIPGAELQAIAGAGHHPEHEQPAAVLELLGRL